MKSDVQKQANLKFGQVIAVTNQKGGVGKSTVVINLGTALGMMGKKVLLIDIDKQINMTTGVLLHPEKAEKKNIGIALQNVLDGKTVNLKRYVIHKPYFDMIAGSRSLYRFKKLFEERPDRNTVYKILLQDTRNDYDYILFDCPPEAGIENVKAYTAATGLVIVSEPTLYSMDGIVDAVEIADFARQSVNRNLKIYGILINRMHKTWKEDKENEEVLRSEYGKHVNVFDTVIPYRAAVSRASSFAKSVMQHRSKDPASIAFKKLAVELVRGVEENA